MSTRANIIISDKYQKGYFYRHSDGYPECTMESLKEFVNMYKDQLRPSVSQSSGWLVLKGAVEYGFKGDLSDPAGDNNRYDFNNWKVGAYEITDQVHGDIEYLYTIDLINKKLKCYKAKYKKAKGEEWGSADEKETLKGTPIAEYDFTSEQEKKLTIDVQSKPSA